MDKTKNAILQFCENLANDHYGLAVSQDTVENIEVILNNLSVNNATMTEEVINEIDNILNDGNRPDSKKKWVMFFALSIGSIIARDLEIQALTKLQEECENGEVTGKN